jgi:hypothetical protein
MRRRSLICLSAFTAVSLAFCSSIAVAQSAKDLVGTWTIVSAEAFGPNPKGDLRYQWSLFSDADASRPSKIRIQQSEPGYCRGI